MSEARDSTSARGDLGRLQIMPLGDGAFLVVGATLASNATVLLRGRQALLIDALGSRLDALALQEWLGSVAHATPQLIVMTHYFSDHLAAAGLYPEASILAHTTFQQTFDTEHNRTEEERAFFVRPTILVKEELALRWGRFDLRIFHNPGYTRCMLNVDLPQLELVHVGDNVAGELALLHYNEPAALRQALDRLRTLGRRSVIQSHGGLRSADTLLVATSYLDALERVAGSVAEPRRGIALADCLPPAAFARTTEHDVECHRRNLEAVSTRGGAR